MPAEGCRNHDDVLREMSPMDPTISDELRRRAELYADGIDQRDPLLLAEQFVEDGVLIAQGSTYTGHDELPQALDLITDRCFASSHALSGQTIEVSPDGAAVARTSCVARHFFRDDDGIATCYEMTLRYHDAFRRVGDEWLFSRRELEVLGTRTLPVEEHELPALLDAE